LSGQAATSVNAPLQDRAAAALSSLRSAGTVAEGTQIEGFRQLQGGWSRHSFVLSLSEGGPPREFVIRVKPRGALLDSDLRQEFLTYKLLGQHGIRAPAVYTLEESEDNPFGGPFFTMAMAPGGAPNVWRREEREALERDWNGPRTLAQDLVQSLAAIHAIPATAVAEVLPRRAFAETVAHWRGVQEEMALVADPVIGEAYEWLGAREIAEVEPALVHGDYRLGNCLIREGRITAILDWELAYFGDPRFDLGYVDLEYHAGKFTRPGSRLLNAVADREWFMSEYQRLSGRRLDADVVRSFSVLGALILLAILTTAVRMYSDERTSDIRMMWSRFAIPGLRQDITRLLDW
jgi:aminoglycoside phosphotransferase (APT) family kinase protein